MALDPNEYAFLGIGLELVLYGIYTVLFVLAVACLLRKRRLASVNKFYLFFCCFLYACCTTHVIIKFRYLYKDMSEAAIKTGIVETGTPALRFADALVTLIDWFAEIVLIYRCWSIWQRNYYVVIFPTILSLAFVCCAVSTIVILSRTVDAAIVPKALVPLGTAAFAIPLTFNFIVTCLIAGRMWYHEIQRRKALRGAFIATGAPQYLRDAIFVIIEAGVLYLLAQFVLTVLFAINHPAQILVSDVAVQIYGIAPTLIIVHVGLGRSFGDTTGTSENNPGSRTHMLRSYKPAVISVTRMYESGSYDNGSPGLRNHGEQEGDSSASYTPTTKEFDVV
ncbi:hypothetical protein BD779DRAFT_1520282 [Infundibulicybe gibba]|nr:hypothetical protein BD779DRAFT_1520282 [Infundibulicybe gibba]